MRVALLPAGALLGFLLCAAGAAAQSDDVVVRGRVADAGGRPLVDFPVVVADGDGRRVALRTGRDGRFQTLGLAAGTLSVELDAQDYAATRVRCRVHTGQSAFIELFASASPEPSLPAPSCRIEMPTADLYIID